MDDNWCYAAHVVLCAGFVDKKLLVMYLPVCKELYLKVLGTNLVKVDSWV